MGTEGGCRVPAGRIVGMLRPPWLHSLKQPGQVMGWGLCLCYLRSPKIAHFLALTLNFPSVFGSGPWSLNCNSQLVTPNQWSAATHVTLLKIEPERDTHCWLL